MSLKTISSLNALCLLLVGCVSTPKDEMPSRALQITNAAEIQGVRDVSYKKMQEGGPLNQVAPHTSLFNATLDYYSIGWAGGISGLVGQAVSGAYGQFIAWVPESEASSGEEAVAKTKALLENSPYWPELQNNQKQKWGWKAEPRRMPYGDNRMNTFLNPVKSFIFTPPPLVEAPSFIGGKAYGPIYFSAPNVIAWDKQNTNVENFSKMSKALPSWIYLYKPTLEFKTIVPVVYNKGDLMIFVTQPVQKRQ
ncbi:hypothetical protein [Pseudomonas fluorescens]|uniref:Lipoprotein n=1 Tax=Pseudomonas fluorescens TaxID=294 RepID=A0A5E7CDE4_PSEFL|nr:hypothetical protein [Pseudomonas fluorescens]VVO02873.1 hypothetical protein PS710_02809 [Pseudomonas fluorescens]